MNPVATKVEQFLRRERIGDAALVAAVSGGPDSVALLRALATVHAGPLVIAHFNHQLRGVDSDDDETFVCRLRTTLAVSRPSDLHLRCGGADVATVAREEHSNLESTARRLRYGWLADVARETGARFVATGHTADDQAETVLHRLLRGTGLKGLSGIAPRRRLAEDVEAVRPLLAVTRMEVLAYLTDLRQDHRHDRTNDDLAYTRSRIRHELLPHLAEHYNPAIRLGLCRLAEQAAESYREETAKAEALLAEAELPRAGSLLVLDRNRLGAAPRQTVCEALRLAWAREGWPMGRMGFAEWDRLAAVALGEAAAVDLPGGVRARACNRVVQIGRPCYNSPQTLWDKP